jgi:HAD superfamily hydrolase (TIGR01450 family)
VGVYICHTTVEMALPRDIDLFIFDVEGTLVDSIDTARALPGARGLVGRIQRAGRKVALLSNIGRKSHREVLRRLRSAGFEVGPSDLMTTGRATALHLQRRGARRVFLLSEGGAREDLRAAGLRTVRGPPADAVVVAAHRGLTYRDLNAATRLVAGGAPLICCGASPVFRGTYRGDSGLFLGEGAVARAIAAATGARVETVGKPDPRIFRETLRQSGVAAGRAAMVGDSRSDMEGAARARLGLRVYLGTGSVEADLRCAEISRLERAWR